MSFHLTIDTDDPIEVVEVIISAVHLGRDFAVQWVTDDVGGDDVEAVLSAIPPTTYVTVTDANGGTVARNPTRAAWEAFQASCSICGAPEGQWCTTEPTGAPVEGFTHFARAVAAAEAVTPSGGSDG